MPTSIKNHILEEIQASKPPLSAAIIKEKLKVLGLNPNKTTIYRSLDSLVKSGIIQEVLIPGQKSSHYEASLHQHGHFSCQNCDTVICIPTEAISDSIHLNVSTSIQISGFAIQGLCQTCNH